MALLQVENLKELSYMQDRQLLIYLFTELDLLTMVVVPMEKSLLFLRFQLLQVSLSMLLLIVLGLTHFLDLMRIMSMVQCQ